MTRIPMLIMFVIVLGLLAGFIASSMRKSSSGLKIMLLGINLTLFGGIIAVDAESNLGGIEYLIALLGLIISAIGLGKEE